MASLKQDDDITGTLITPGDAWPSSSIIHLTITMRAIFLSPHFDDAIFSCGGLIHSLVAAGRPAEVWTLCAGSPPDILPSEFAASLHARWGLDGAEVVAARRAEDQAACALLGVVPRHFSLPDCIYRLAEDGSPLYASEADIFGALHPEDTARLAELAVRLHRDLGSQDALYVPLTVGNHVDHQLARRVAESLDRPLHFYADVPYALRPEATVAALVPSDATALIESISSTALTKWVEASLAYVSQVDSFWAGEEVLHAALASFIKGSGGLPMWRTAN